MTTLLVTHPSSYEHLKPPGHPERTDRLRAIETVLAEPRFAALKRVQAPAAELEAIALCHPMAYVEEIRNASPKDGFVDLVHFNEGDSFERDAVLVSLSEEGQ